MRKSHHPSKIAVLSSFWVLSVRLARAMAASICFLSARDSFFFVFTGCTVFSSVFPNIRCSHLNVIDSGVAVLSMHALWEVANKADIYEAYRGYKAFIERA